jgi:hypothetical protein
VNVPNFGPGTNPEVLRRWALTVEGLGFDLLMVSDHIAVTPDVAEQYPVPFYEPFTTLSWLAGNLRSRGPASLAVCAMLRKPGSAQMHVDVRYTGFDIGDEFVVGYGLDYAQRYRNLPFIGTLAPAVYGGG